MKDVGSRRETGSGGVVIEKARTRNHDAGRSVTASGLPVIRGAATRPDGAAIDGVIVDVDARVIPDTDRIRQWRPGARPAPLVAPAGTAGGMRVVNAVVPRRRRSAPIVAREVSGTGGDPRRATRIFSWEAFGRIGDRLASFAKFRNSPKPTPVITPINPEEWAPVPKVPPTRLSTLASFLPSPGVWIAILIAVPAWGALGGLLFSVQPTAPYALIWFMAFLLVAVTATVAPISRATGLAYGRTHRYRDSVWLHSVRQGILVGVLLIGLAFLGSLRMWSPLTMTMLTFGVIALEALVIWRR